MHPYFERFSRTTGDLCVEGSFAENSANGAAGADDERPALLIRDMRPRIDSKTVINSRSDVRRADRIR